MIKIALDAGHSLITPGKRTPDGEREWSFNNTVLLACAERLQTYRDVEILRLDDPTGATDIPLRTRTGRANAWKADVLVSIHHNANASKWGAHGGVETLIQPGASKASRDIANAVNPRIVAAMGLRNRGVKTQNLHMTRESRMPAILTEGGFMDSTTDIGALCDPAKLRAQGYAIAEGLAEYFGLKPKLVAHVAPIIKEDVKLYQPTSKAIKDSTEAVLKQLEQGENGLADKWRKQFLDGTLTDSDAIGLVFVAIQRGLLKE